jgi:ribonuclease HI
VVANSEKGETVKDVQLILDGSAIGNPGPGGWCCILRCGEAERVLTGGEAATTNNRMELTAAIQGLRALRGVCKVQVVTDSQYLSKGMSEYISRWRVEGWRGANGKPVLNRDLWEELLALTTEHQVQWTWVRGHAGNNRDQERAAGRQQAEAVHV